MKVLRVTEYLGCPIAYSAQGHGPPILFIQGVGVHGDGWMPQIDELAAEFTCISFDNRGMGKSIPANQPISVGQMTEDALAVLDAERIDRAHIVGHSLGGLVAIQLALSHRNLVRSLSLLCTFAGGSSAAPLTTRMIWLGLRSRIGTRRMRRKGFLRLVMPPGPINNPDAEAERLAALFGHDLADQPEIVSKQLKALRAWDTTSRLSELAGLPTLIVNAVHDPIAPPRAGHQLRDGIPGSRYLEAENASHGLPITHSAYINRLLHEHLSLNRA
jgi:pimeloyl-ACP methyl ester carboxylesterase